MIRACFVSCIFHNPVHWTVRGNILDRVFLRRFLSISVYIILYTRQYTIHTLRYIVLNLYIGARYITGISCTIELILCIGISKMLQVTNYEFISINKCLCDDNEIDDKIVLKMKSTSCPYWLYI